MAHEKLSKSMPLFTGGAFKHPAPCLQPPRVKLFITLSYRTHGTCKAVKRVGGV
jgi:hypothetical protein